MACMKADGTPTQSGLGILAALDYGIKRTGAIAEFTELALPTVKSCLSDLLAAGLVRQYGETYEITEKGGILLK